MHTYVKNINLNIYIMYYFHLHNNWNVYYSIIIKNCMYFNIDILLIKMRTYLFYYKKYYRI